MKKIFSIILIVIIVVFALDWLSYYKQVKTVTELKSMSSLFDVKYYKKRSSCEFCFLPKIPGLSKPYIESAQQTMEGKSFLNLKNKAYADLINKGWVANSASVTFENGGFSVSNKGMRIDVPVLECSLDGINFDRKNTYNGSQSIENCMLVKYDYYVSGN